MFSPCVFRSLKLVEADREEQRRGGFDGAHGPRPPGDGRPEPRPQSSSRWAPWARRRLRWSPLSLGRVLPPVWRACTRSRRCQCTSTAAQGSSCTPRRQQPPERSAGAPAGGFRGGATRGRSCSPSQHYTMLQEASNQRTLFEELARDDSSNLAIVPWAPSQSQTASTVLATATEMMDVDAEDSEGMSKEVEQDRCDQFATADTPQGEAFHW